MSIDPHWYSTLYIWYSMVSTLSSAVAAIILVAVHLKKKEFYLSLMITTYTI